KNETLIRELYGQDEITERHRHRYEFNNDYREILETNGMILSGTSPDGYIVETVEYRDKSYFIGVQFHPEFKSRPNRPHPLFIGLIKAALLKKE
ncbi:MAG: gamma-glutamyl-gamma-aminobutyrate hydrolase family protein, partial [Erysipelotrichaceae bacterium]|nr:gamma-glutamyl-gamma-aminobutyrate hydrolase family protein [Erysipelotrichaceae bacterium]